MALTNALNIHTNFYQNRSMFARQHCDLENKVSRLDSTKVHFTKVLVLDSRAIALARSHSQQDAADFTINVVSNTWYSPSLCS